MSFLAWYHLYHSNKYIWQYIDAYKCVPCWKYRRKRLRNVSRRDAVFGALSWWWHCGVSTISQLFRKIFDGARIPTSLATALCICYSDMGHITQEIAQLRCKAGYKWNLSKFFFSQSNGWSPILLTQTTLNILKLYISDGGLWISRAQKLGDQCLHNL
jgi:hypothetical protein